MPDRFSDDELNVGKILVLEKGHGLKTKRIKELTNAKKVTQLRWNKKTSPLDYFLLMNIERAMVALGHPQVLTGNIYRVVGKHAVSTMLSLNLKTFCMTLDLATEDIKRIHNACLLKRFIDEARFAVEHAQKQHSELVDALSELSIVSNLGSKTSSLDEIVDGYADAELAATIEKIKAATAKSW